MPIIDPKFNQDMPAKQTSQEVFSISRFHLLRHILALILTVFLSFSLFTSELLHQLVKHQGWHIDQMTMPYVLLMLFMLIIALMAIFSVRKLAIRKDGLEINNLFWQEKANWQDVKSYNAPKHLRFGWLKTRRSLYLIVKPEFKNYADLEYMLKQHIEINN